MNQDQSAEFVRDRKEPVQAGVGKFGISYPRADLDTEKSRVTHAPAQLIDGSVGVLQRDRSQRSEAGRVLVGDPGEEIVLRRRQFAGAARRGGVTERHRDRGKHLHRNAFTIHIDDPSFR
jgi:hypothetical protein